MEPFEASWLRVERARSHRESLAEAWNSYTEADVHSIVLDNEGKGRFILRVIEEVPPPPEMAVLIGEWLYNLRSALDYVIYDSAICVSGKSPPPGHGQLQFPVYDTPEIFAEQAYRLKPLADHHRAMLEKMQPYRHKNPDTSALGWLNRLARIDRHRRLTVQTSYMAEMHPMIKAPRGCTATLQFGERVIGANGEAQIARIKVTPWREGWQIEANPRTGIDPEIAEWAISPFWARIPYNQRLDIIAVFVETTIVAFEYDCIGSSRKADYLTDAFRVESDARRQPRQPPSHSQAPVKWGSPIAGTAIDSEHIGWHG